MTSSTTLSTVCLQIPRIHTKQSKTKTDTHMKRLIALTVCSDCVASSSHLCRRTDSIFEAGYCSTSTAAARVLQTERIRYWSVRDLCRRRWLGRPPLARLGRRHGLHLLVSMEICRCQVPRGGTRYQWRWRSTKQNVYFSRRGNCNCFRRRRQCGGGCGYGRLHVAIAVR